MIEEIFKGIFFGSIISIFIALVYGEETFFSVSLISSIISSIIFLLFPKSREEPVEILMAIE